MSVNITYEMQKEWLLRTATDAVRDGQRANDDLWISDAQAVLDAVRPLSASDVALMSFDYSNDEATGKRISFSPEVVEA